ncbi:MAG TPA: SpoIIE family protein phosphatase [Actinomycetota bacterium]|nr:SpoIIE family protein phosphatase [Actinomycetota bacterium]
MKRLGRPRSGEALPPAGSWRWAVRLVEGASWATLVLTAVLFQFGSFTSSQYGAGLAALAALAVLLFVLFRVALPLVPLHRWVAWPAILVGLAIGVLLYGVLRGEVPSAELIFVPLIFGAGLLGGVVQGLAVGGLSAVAYGVAGVIGEIDPRPEEAVLTAGVFLLVGALSGLVARELRSHYRGEKQEHILASAVRHRLMAVLDAVDEAVLFRDREGTIRIVNRRAAELFEVDPGVHQGHPIVTLLRDIARKTEDPEGFMEAFQQLLDDPEADFRVEIEQIIPERRRLRLYSGPTFDEEGVLVGRIDVFTDISESVQREEQVKRLYEQARRTAERYQRSLLPERIPDLPRVSLIAHYVAAAGPRAVCGDFYDFISLPNGRVGLVIGDVCGIGPTAANDAALTRYTLRALAAESLDPADLLVELNEQISAQLPSERFVRLFFGVLDPERAKLDYANAGHVPPVVYRSHDKSVSWLEEGGIALGIEDDAVYKIGQLDLAAGDMLVLYTDGVTEAPRHGRPLGQGRFRDLVESYGMGTPGELIQALGRSVDAWVSDELRDDLALLVCQIVPDALLGEPVRELVLPNEPERIAEIRRFVSDFLTDVRAPVEASAEVLIAVGEAAGNATRHGRRPAGRSEVRVRCALDKDSVLVTIADDGPGFDVEATPSDVPPDPLASGGRGLYLMEALMDEVHIDSSPEGTLVLLVRDVSTSRWQARPSDSAWSPPPPPE